MLKEKNNSFTIHCRSLRDIYLLKSFKHLSRYHKVGVTKISQNLLLVLKNNCNHSKEPCIRARLRLEWNSSKVKNQFAPTRNIKSNLAVIIIHHILCKDHILLSRNAMVEIVQLKMR